MTGLRFGMKFRYFTDAHMEDERTPSRPFRYSERAADLIEECINSCDDDANYIVFGGDAIQMNRGKGKPHLESLVNKFGRFASSAAKPFKFITGNHELDYFGGLKAVSGLVGIDVKNEVVDTDDGHRLIFIHSPFHKKGYPSILPFTDEAIDFIEKAVNEAPTKSVTLFSHTPLDHTDWYEMKVLMHDGDPEYCFRPNAAVVRDILENSGKNCLVVSGHSHFEGVTRDKNVVYMTVQSLVEGVRTDPDQVFARWVDIERSGENDIHLKMHGYKARDYAWHFNASGVHDQSCLLAAE